MFARWRTIGAAVALATLAACSSDLGSEKLKTLKPGANREAILAAMGTGPLVASRPSEEPRVVNGFLLQIFITNARRIDVLWYREQPGGLDDQLNEKIATPVVIENDTLVGWGWDFYHPFAAQMKLPDPPRDAARIDSISKSQQPKS